MVQRIASVDDNAVTSKVQEYFAIAERRGAPNPTLLRILARDPDSLSIFYEAWNRSFYDSERIDHGLKEIVRVRMARVRGCGY